jgi:hypothetical protein
MEHEFDVHIICRAGIRLSDHHGRHSLSESLRPMQRSLLFENIFSEGASNGAGSMHERLGKGGDQRKVSANYARHQSLDFQPPLARPLLNHKQEA